MIERYCSLIEYKGYNYSGWQCQPFLSVERTVEAQVERALSAVAGRNITCVCAGRTDAGVNALGQVVHFDSEISRDGRARTFGANSHLPPDIRIVETVKIAADFDARRSALSRTYRYVILNRSVASGVFSRYCWHIPQKLSVEKMQEAEQYLLGERDFSAFRSAQCQAKSPFRRFDALKVVRVNDFVIIEVRANAFLHNMVRNIVGTLVEVGRGKRPPEWIAEVLASLDRRKAGMTAVPYGLYLYRVEYPEKFGVPEVSDFVFPFGLGNCNQNTGK